MDKFCLIDIGSTTTKAFLFRQDTSWEDLRCEAPTTVEKPYEDVTLGVLEALRELERMSNETLLRDDKPSIPVFATSSAGGGLAMIVAGLVREVTARSAELVALGAGGVLQDVIALDDERTPYQKIELLKKRRPDILLLAGGFDGGAIFGPVFLAELLRQAELRPKLGTHGQLPVIYAGNVNAREYVKEILRDHYTYLEAPNVRPASHRENLEPARDAIHNCFMDHVMSRAPGYERFTDWVSAPILPTPAAVAGLLKLVSEEMEGGIMVIDIGGATTDVFTAVGGRVFRTVSANLGLSYSILNVVRKAGIDSIHKLVGFDIDRTSLLNYIGNKYIHPTALPSTIDETKFECAVASVAVREAVRAHFQVIRNLALSRSHDDLGWGRFRSIRRHVKGDPNRLDMSAYDLVIGSGGKLSHSPPDTAAAILINALNPNTSLRLAVDNSFIFPQLGVLAQSFPDLSKTLFHECGLIRLGTFVPCRGRPKPGTAAIELITTDGTEEKRRGIACGTVEILPCENSRAGTIHLKPRRLKPDVRRDFGTEDVAVIIDARGNRPDPPCGWFIPDSYQPKQRSGRLDTAEIPREILIEEPRELAIPGDVLVKFGDVVQPDTLVARSTQTFRRPFFIDVAESLSLKVPRVLQTLTVGIGDEVHAGDIIASYKPGTITTDESTAGGHAGSWRSVKTVFGETKVARSGVTGTVERILPNGTIVIREKGEIVTAPHSVDVVHELHIRPQYFARCLRCEEGQEVEKGQLLAVDGAISSPGSRRCVSPIRGRVKSISRELGAIVIEPISLESRVHAWLPGTVSSVSDRGCTVSTPGVLITGVWGRGDLVAGPLITGEPMRGSIVARPSASANDIEQFRSIGITGLIAGSVDLHDIESLSPGFATVLINGFGSLPLDDSVWSRLIAHDGSIAALDPTTHLRAGVIRPRIILPTV